jgi:hypothetical protein
VPAADRDVGVLTRTQVVEAHRARVVLQVKTQQAADHVDRLVLVLVDLERQPPAGLDDDDLAGVAIRVGPDQLVAPRLVDPSGRARGLAHEPRTSRSPASSIDSLTSSEVASV